MLNQQMLHHIILPDYLAMHDYIQYYYIFSFNIMIMNARLLFSAQVAYCGSDTVFGNGSFIDHEEDTDCTRSSITASLVSYSFYAWYDFAWFCEICMVFHLYVFWWVVWFSNCSVCEICMFFDESYVFFMSL